MTSRLRPMDLRDLLDETFDLYKSNFVLFFSVAAVALFPAHALLFGLISSDASEALPVDLAVMMDLLGPVLFLLAGLVTLFTAGALAHAISERYRGRPVTVKQAYRAAFRNPFRLLYTLVVVVLALGVFEFCGLLIPLGFLGGLFRGTGGDPDSVPFVLIGVAIMLAVPVIALWIVFHFALAIPAFFLEDASGYAAVKRSFELYFYDSRKSALGLFLIAGIGFVATLVLSVLALVPASMLAPLVTAGSGALVGGLQGALFGIVQVMVMPLPLTFIVLLYYDHRIRKEGLDLQIVAEELRESRGARGIAANGAGRDI